MSSNDIFVQQLVAALAYAEVFHSPLRRWQINQYWPGSIRYQSQAMTSLLLHNKSVWNNSLWKYQDWHQAIAGQQQQWPQAVQTDICKISKLVRFIPAIDSLWLTGSLAMKRNDSTADIDFLVVCHSGTMWSVRALISIWALWQGKLRRRYSRHNAGRWCFNYWLESQQLEISPRKRNLYQARELVQAIPLYQSQPTSARQLLLHNYWAAGFTRTGWLYAWNRAASLPPRLALVWYFPGLRRIFIWLLQLFNPLAFYLQRRFMDEISSDAKVSYSQAAFHSIYRESEILNKYETIRRSFWH